MHIKVGTRGSKLALKQSEYVIAMLKEIYPQHTYETIVIKTKGDHIQDISLRKIGDKGLFVKEIEEQLLQEKIDMAVHSMKDMPSLLPEELTFSKTCKREDPRDVLILPKERSYADLPAHAVIGTGSLRRSVQVKSLFPDAIIKDIRGNVDTRLRKLDEGQYDAIIMAAAGLKRLGLQDRISRYFDICEMVPACAQGALAMELRKDNKELQKMLDHLCNEEDDRCVKAERKFLAGMNGSCHVPVGANCRKHGEGYELYAIYGDDKEQTAVFHGVAPDVDQLVKKAILYMKNEIREN